MDGLRTTTLAGLDAVRMGMPALPKEAKDQDAALKFEALLWSQVFQTMRKSITAGGLFGEENQARSTFEYLFDQVVVEASMQSGKSLGFAERLLKGPLGGTSKGDTT